MSQHRYHHSGHRQVSTRQGTTTSSPSSSRHGAPAQVQTEIDRVVEHLRSVLTRTQLDQINRVVLLSRNLGIEIGSYSQQILISINNKMVDRYHLFLSMPTRDMAKYLHQLRQCSQTKSDPHKFFQIGARMLPGIEDFVRSIRTRQFDERRDGNFFTWWNQTLNNMTRQNGVSRTDLLRWDEKLIRHLVEYEIVNQRDSAVSNQLPPISDSRQATEGPLPSVNQILRQGMTGSYSNQSWGSSGNGNAGSSSQGHSSRGRRG